MYTAAEGAEDIFLKGQFFLISLDPPHHPDFFDKPPLDQKKNGNPSPPSTQYDEEVTDMDTLTHSLTHAHEYLQTCRAATLKGSPLLSVLGQLLNGSPGVL